MPGNTIAGVAGSEERADHELTGLDNADVVSIDDSNSESARDSLEPRGASTDPVPCG